MSSDKELLSGTVCTLHMVDWNLLSDLDCPASFILWACMVL